MKILLAAICFGATAPLWLASSEAIAQFDNNSKDCKSGYTKTCNDGSIFKNEKPKGNNPFTKSKKREIASAYGLKINKRRTPSIRLLFELSLGMHFR